MASAELAARLRALREQLLAEIPEIFRFEDPGDVCSGAFVKFDGQMTRDGQAVQTLVYTDQDDQLRSLWLFHKVLQEQVAALELVPGQLFAITYRGTRTSAQGRTYKAYSAVAEPAGTENGGAPADDVPPF